MGKGIRIVLVGPPYNEPRYYGQLEWNDNNVYIRHPEGGKDSRHKDGFTYIHSKEIKRIEEQRIPMSEVSREIVNYIKWDQPFEPPLLQGTIKETDFVVNTEDAGINPRLAVEIVENKRLSGVLFAWQSHSTAPSVKTFENKGNNQSLIIAVAGSLTSSPST